MLSRWRECKLARKILKLKSGAKDTRLKKYNLPLPEMGKRPTRSRLASYADRGRLIEVLNRIVRDSHLAIYQERANNTKREARPKMAEFPGDLKYANSHEWVRIEDDGTATIGISDHAQEALGDVVYVELPELELVLNVGDEAGVVESVKAASDLYAPISGTIILC